MDIKVAASIILSIVIGYLVYAFNDSIFLGLSTFLFTVYIAIILILATVDVFLIIRQRVKRSKLIMILFLVLSLLSSMILGRIDIQKKMIEGNQAGQSSPGE